ncbi:MAG: glycine cleavage system aminomethyltransferase GcvT [Armatimonadetes bacterium]|nr:glycine cleavage system aminomethyltransferase GcvT [Armatimonadota bacterium]
MAETTLQRTALHEVHLGAGARMVEFAGWEMPVLYQGVQGEHLAVRSRAGLFDLSHMGEIWVRGPGCFSWVQGLVTNDLEAIEPFRAMYTCMTDPQGKVLDDLLVYRFPDEVLLVVNASNREKIAAWMENHLPASGVEMEDRSLATSLLAIQGPRAQELLAPLTQTALGEIGYYRFVRGKVAGLEAIISRTGYTGEDGFELYVDWDAGPRLWEALMAQCPGLAPVGLGARDTLRLESGYALYGHELTEEITPLDAGLGWVVKLDGAEFIGRSALLHQKSEGVRRTIVGFEMEGRAIPREGFQVFHEGNSIGRVTSGTFSPTLQKGIGLAIVEGHVRAAGTPLEIEIRARRCPARVARPPFVRGSVRRG